MKTVVNCWSEALINLSLLSQGWFRAAVWLNQELSAQYSAYRRSCLESEPPDACKMDIDHVDFSEVAQFIRDVNMLLDLLLNERFAHPFGTVAGSVA